MILSSDREFVERCWLYVKCWVRDLDSYGSVWVRQEVASGIAKAVQE
jgi:hypothetical protein